MYQKSGANSALYSLKLMHYASLELEKYDDFSSPEYGNQNYGSTSPLQVLQESFNRVMEDAEKEVIRQNVSFSFFSLALLICLSIIPSILDPTFVNHWTNIPSSSFFSYLCGIALGTCRVNYGIHRTLTR